MSNAANRFLPLLLLGALAACAATDDDFGEQSAAVGRNESDPAKAKADREAARTTVHRRNIVLHISDPDGAAWASIDTGSPGDETWLDRTFDGGKSWDKQLGKTKIPERRRDWRTMMHSIDDPKAQKIGAVRACGKAGNRKETVCTEWHRSAADNRVDAAATALMQFYDPNKALFSTTGWWNSANALTAMIDYDETTGSRRFRYVVENTFDKHASGKFTNEYMDDTAWWGLAWIRAYDLTKEKRYLDMARHDADYLWTFKDSKCGGGVWWRSDKKYKNAITNELFIKLAASLHNRISGDTTYLSRALEIWSWFLASGLVNAQNLVNDGLDDGCKNNGQPTWTYNQGVILGGLVELHRATSDQRLLDSARQLATASTSDGGLNPSGVLHEPCEDWPNGCGVDGASFKGIFVRNLAELDRSLPGRPFRTYLARQADTLHAKNRNSIDQYGIKWAGPFDSADAARQHSALEAFVAASE